MPALATPIRHGKTAVTLTPIFDDYLIFQHVVRLRSIIVKHSINIGHSLYSFSRIGLALSFALNLSVAVLHAQSPSRFKSPSAATSSPKIHFDTPQKIVPDSQPSNERFVASTRPKWTIAIHGGAGGDLERWTAQQQQARIQGLQAALRRGVELLEKSTPAVDVAEAVVRVLEDDPNFNAGRGAVLNEIGEFSLDASLMDGSDLSCGAVANVRKTRNPISLARAVRDKTPHVFLCGHEADEFGVQVGLATEGGDYFKTEEQIESWKAWKERQAAKKNSTSRHDHDRGEDRLFYLGTVGCVVMDADGNLAAATSTGGLLGKKYGRIGDTPVIGAGTYANNQSCAVSCTGIGELFIKNHVASAISSRMEHLGEPLEKAVGHAIAKTLPVDSGGIIAVDASGNIETQFNTPIMARGQANSDGLFRVALSDWVE
jgi:beta-aspartyl-peptidase (threonine type)